MLKAKTHLTEEATKELEKAVFDILCLLNVEIPPNFTGQLKISFCEKKGRLENITTEFIKSENLQ